MISSVEEVDRTSPAPIIKQNLLRVQTFVAEPHTNINYATSQQNLLQNLTKNFGKLDSQFARVEAEKEGQKHIILSQENSSAKLQQASVTIFPLLILSIAVGILIGLCIFWVFRKISIDKQNKYVSDYVPEEEDKDITFTRIDDFPENDNFNPNSSSIIQNQQAIQTATRLPKIDIIGELIKDLGRSSEPAKRQKTIWELAQRGDSRAIEPLVELLITADSYERGLISTAITEIASRALKPMNEAFSITLEDANPQVRKNAIRDVTKVYELMSQITQRLSHMADDNDVEVQETVQWALKELDRVQWRNIANQQNILKSKKDIDEDEEE